MADVVHWVIFCLVVLLAARAVDVLMLLTSQVFDDSFQLWRKISLSSMPLERLDMLGEFLELHRSLVHVWGLWLFFGLLIVFLHFNKSGLMCSQLIFENFINYFKFWDLIKIIAVEMFQVLLLNLYFEQRRVTFDLLKVFWYIYSDMVLISNRLSLRSVLASVWLILAGWLDWLFGSLRCRDLKVDWTVIYWWPHVLHGWNWLIFAHIHSFKRWICYKSFAPFRG